MSHVLVDGDRVARIACGAFHSVAMTRGESLAKGRAHTYGIYIPHTDTLALLALFVLLRIVGTYKLAVPTSQ